MSKKTFSDGLPTLPGTIRFHTTNFIFAAPRGEGWSGFCDLTFFTPEQQPDYVTMLSPEGVASLAENLASISGTAPRQYTLGGKLVGNIKADKNTTNYFGQNFQNDVTMALGVLMIRANLIDQGLIDLTRSLTNMSKAQATAQYYSSVNMKARLDSVRAITLSSHVSDHTKDLIAKTLEMIKKASDRRNSLVHGRWNMRKGKHRVELYKPLSQKTFSEITINEKHILDIAEAYSTSVDFLAAALDAVEHDSESGDKHG